MSRRKRPEEQEHARSPEQAASTGATPGLGGILALQRSVGNAAVARALSSGGSNVLAREEEDPEGSGSGSYTTYEEVTASQGGEEEAEEKAVNANDPAAQLAAALKARAQVGGSPEGEQRPEFVSYTLEDSQEEAKEEKAEGLSGVEFYSTESPEKEEKKEGLSGVEFYSTETPEKEEKKEGLSGVEFYSTETPEKEEKKEGLSGVEFYSTESPEQEQQSTGTGSRVPEAKPPYVYSSSQQDGGSSFKPASGYESVEVGEGGGASAPAHPLAQNVPKDPYVDTKKRRFGKTKGMVGYKEERQSSLEFVKSLLTNLGGLFHDASKFLTGEQGAKVQAFLVEKRSILDRLKGDANKNERIAALAKIRMAFMDDRDLVSAALKNLWGWSPKEIYLFHANRHELTPQRVDMKVKYFDQNDPKAKEDLTRKHAVIPGERGWTIGDPPKPLDTSSMSSKASGPGFAIFVMDPEGRIYAGQHRVGLFHHSSFLGGTEVAAAGEIQVQGGTLVSVTAKSGHYMPTPEHTQQFLTRLSDAGVNLSGVEIKSWESHNGTMVTRIYDAAEFEKNGTTAPVKRQEAAL